MELDELKLKWAEYDRKLDAAVRLNRRVLRETYKNRTRSAIGRLVAMAALGAAVQVLAAGALGSFIYGHIASARFAIPAAILDLFTFALLIASIRQIVAALQIDYGQPVAVIQRQLEFLRVLRIRYIQGIFLLAPLAWVPLLIVGLKMFFGLDAYRWLDTAWLWANVLFGWAIIPVALWCLRNFGDEMSRSPLVRGIVRDLAGQNLKAATGFLSTLAEFEHEQSAS